VEHIGHRPLVSIHLCLMLPLPCSPGCLKPVVNFFSQNFFFVAYFNAVFTLFVALWFHCSSVCLAYRALVTFVLLYQNQFHFFKPAFRCFHNSLWLGSAIAIGAAIPNPPNPIPNPRGLAIAAPSYSGPSPSLLAILFGQCIFLISLFAAFMRNVLRGDYRLANVWMHVKSAL